MKNKFTRIISFLLMLSLLFSVLATAALAADGAEGETEEEDDGITVIYNRNYEEGWDYGVGVYAIPRAQRFEIEYEEDENFNYNYYWRLEGRVNESSQYGYFDLLTGGNAPSDGISVLEFDIKTDDAIKNMKKNSEMTEDEAKSSEKSVQDLTDKYIKEIDGVTAVKTKEIMEI